MEWFARPEWLWLLAGLPLLVILVGWGRSRTLRDWTALGQPGVPRGHAGWSWVLALALLIVALAQPRWGRAPGSPLPPGQDLALLVDTSLSMGARDAVPDRLGAAVESAQSLVAVLGREPGNRAAVVAFAGRGVERCPLTGNLGAVIDALQQLRPGDVQPAGTNLGDALEVALRTFEGPVREAGRSIVIFSDGEDHAGSWESAIPRLREAGVLVHCVALGDAEHGQPVPAGPAAEPLTYHGVPVASHRDDQALEAVARATGGAMIPLGLASADLGELYATRIAPQARRRSESSRTGELIERYPLFIIGALVVGLSGSWPRWRRRSIFQWSCALVALAGSVGADGETAGQATAAGQAAYAAGDYERALEAFERALALDPASAIPRYDAAATLYQMGRYAAARQRYQQARDRSGPGLSIKIDYALGNTSLALGEVAAAIERYDACLASRVAGPAYDAVRRDAAINRQFALRLIDQPPEPTAGKAREPARKPRRGTPDQERSTDSRAHPAPGASPPQGDDGEPGQPSRGGGGSAQPGPAPSAAGSPEARLDEALENAQAARRRRPVDMPPASAAEEGQKPW